MHEIPDELARGPFTLARAAELGLSARVVSGSRFRTPWPGVRAARGAPDTLLERCRAAKLVLPETAVFTHGTALYLGDWLTPGPPTTRPAYDRREPEAGTALHVSVPHGTARPRGRGLAVHRWQPEPHDVIDLAGLMHSSGARTWCDCGADGALLTDLVVLADALRRHDDPGGRVMLQRLTGWCGRRGYRILVRALGMSRDGVDSPMETRLRLLVVEAGLPDPLVNEWVRDEHGAPLHRPDLSWPRWKVALDYDGRHHRQRDEEEAVRTGQASDWRQRQDESRRDLLADHGWAYRVFSSFDVLRRSGLAAERVRVLLRRNGAPV